MLFLPAVRDCSPGVRLGRYARRSETTWNVVRKLLFYLLRDHTWAVCVCLSSPLRTLPPTASIVGKGRSEDSPFSALPPIVPRRTAQPSGRYSSDVVSCGPTTGLLQDTCVTPHARTFHPQPFLQQQRLVSSSVHIIRLLFFLFYFFYSF